MDKYICIHGHFYQPPRENPWLETVELQESAYPYHDWNSRITAECYQPNTAARIQDSDGRIQDIVNNYSKISFNFGPTLIAWLEDRKPSVYAALQEADKVSRERFSGHGSAIAQAYNHIIMPLACRRDKITQVIWGIRDFEERFSRKPEGMWLPETAVDLETLDILAEHGILYTILSPYQAKRIRPLGGTDEEWIDAEGGHIDPTRPYLQKLASGRKIALFFYDGPISQSIAFGGLLDKGENLAERLFGAFNDDRDWEQLVHIATDGETYGHHHKYGDMALAYALDYIESHGLARITNYGEYLEKFPAQFEVEVVENTAWSCSHGVGRWCRNCGCNSGGHLGWSQEWRGPLRAALDWLRDELAPLYDTGGKNFFKDPWAARDEYIEVILDRTRRQEFMARHGTHELSEAEQIEALKLLEIQRHAMLMYTSCGWFFDELSGIETVQVIQYAARALQLAGQLFDKSLEPEFLNRLAEARSNIPENGDGRTVFEKFVRPAEVDLGRVAAHYAVSSLFDTYPDTERIYCFTVDRKDFKRLEAGPVKLLISYANFVSEITRESEMLTFGALHFGDQNLSGGVRRFRDEQEYREMAAQLTEAFDRADISDVLRGLDQSFHELTFSLESLFKDEQQRALKIILQPALSEAEAGDTQVYQNRAGLLRYLHANHHPVPSPLQAAAEFAINAALENALAVDPLNVEHIRNLLEESKRLDLTLDDQGLGYKLANLIDQEAQVYEAEPGNLEELGKFETLVDVANSMPFGVRLWSPQNRYFRLLHTLFPDCKNKSDGGDQEALEWVERFLELGDKLHIQVPEPPKAATVEPPAGAQTAQPPGEPVPA